MLPRYLGGNKIRNLIAGAMACGLMLASAAPAATIIHDYEFDGSGVTDSVGGADGALYNGASVGGGYLTLDGVDDYVELAAIFPDQSTAFSVYVSFIDHAPQVSYREVVSQDGGSFYFGQNADGRFRFTDSDYDAGGPFFPNDGLAHDLLLTTNGSNDSNLYLDGTLIFHKDGQLASSPGPGSRARFGRQYGPHGEYFQGRLDAVRVFSGVASYADASGAVPEPASWAMMLGGFFMVGAAVRRRRPASARSANK